MPAEHDDHSVGQPSEHAEHGGHAGHAAHDELLVARFVGGDVADAEADAARGLLSTCPECRLLASDLLAISRATADLPAPTRTRGFRLSPEEAARLRRSGPRNWLSRLAGGVEGGPGRLVRLQRLAAAAVAIGLVMAAVTLPVGIPGFSSGATTLKTVGQAVSGPEGAAPGVGTAGAAGAAPTAGPAAAAAAPAASAAGPAAMAAASAAPAPGGPLTVPGPSGPPAADRSSASGAPIPPSGAIVPAPGQSAQPGVAFNRAAPPTGPSPGGRPPIEAWQAWLLVAMAGLVVFGLIRLRMRRAG